ncbi:AAA family ATPase [Phormidesmis sp. 146-12]
MGAIVYPETKDSSYSLIMLKSLKIENFRGFRSFELQQLGRVNLLVGTNNSGKTSILEAIQLLCLRANLEPLENVMISRGEIFPIEVNRSSGRTVQSRVLDIRHLFYDREIDLDSKLLISGLRDGNDERLSMVIKRRRLFDGNDERINDRLEISDDEQTELVVQWLSERENEEIAIKNRWFPLSTDLGLPTDNIRRSPKDSGSPPINTRFVTPFSLPADEMIEMFEDHVVLKPEEEIINKALNNIEPKIERIAPISSRKNTYSRLNSRAGFLVKLSGSDQRVPIGSMGDGMWRMLGLALSVVSAKGGVLLVDEIDTGLHFTVMSDMWKLIWETAKRLDVQVFATTHSSDCWTSLADIAKSEDASEQGITIHRIEREKSTSVVFDERKIVIAANREIEVR